MTQSIRLAMGWKVRGLNPGGGKIFLDFPHLSRAAVGSAQPHIQWVPGHSPGVKQLGCGIDHLLDLTPRLEKE